MTKKHALHILNYDPHYGADNQRFDNFLFKIYFLLNKMN